MGAVRTARRDAPARDLFAVVAPAEPAPPVMTKAAAAVLAFLDKLLAALDRPGRDFASRSERVLSGHRLVTRDVGPNGHLYRAWERADAFAYGVTLDELTWGRIDTRRPLRALDLRVAIDHQLAREAEARDLIRELCPETLRRAGETMTGAGVYDGPGYVLVTSDPAVRLRIACGARRPA